MVIGFTYDNQILTTLNWWFYIPFEGYTLYNFINLFQQLNLILTLFGLIYDTLINIVPEDLQQQ